MYFFIIGLNCRSHPDESTIRKSTKRNIQISSIELDQPKDYTRNKKTPMKGTNKKIKNVLKLEFIFFPFSFHLTVPSLAQCSINCYKFVKATKE